jgi:hypothetical protein
LAGKLEARPTITLDTSLVDLLDRFRGRITNARVTGVHRQARVLTIGFSDGTNLTVASIHDDADDAVENWDLFSPEGLVLIYGPKGRWKLADASKCN